LAEIYFIEPENTDFLQSLSQDPIINATKIKRIEIDPSLRRWTLHMHGQMPGTQEFWDDIATRIIAAIPEVDVVEFAWEQVSVEEAYMEQVLKGFTPQPVQYSTGSGGASKGEKPARRSSRRKVMQESINGTTRPIKDIQEEERGVTIAGEVVAVETRQTRSGSTLVTFSLYDGTDTINCKVFVDEGEELPIKRGAWYKVQGGVQYQSFDNQLSLMVQTIAAIDPPPPLQDNAPHKRVELHLHTKMSGLDGIIDVTDAVAMAASLGHSAVAITDHGVIQAFPDAYWAGKKHNVKILYGVEGYLVNEEKGRSYHVILLAKNRTGLKNVYRLISLSHMQYFYRRPRIPRQELVKYRDGLLVGSACEAGEVYQAVLRRDPRVREIAAFYDYLEIQPLGNNAFLIGTEFVKTKEDLINLNKQILQLGKELGKPVVATGDVHFLRPKDDLYRSILLAGHGFEDAERQAPLFFRTTEEMLP
jgi:DNA polymerase-3 subunit alpha (Gram-positive type)